MKDYGHMKGLVEEVLGQGPPSERMAAQKARLMAAYAQRAAVPKRRPATLTERAAWFFRQRWPILVPALAASAALLVAIVYFYSGRQNTMVAPAYRLKSALQVKVFAKRDGQVIPVTRETAFQARDALRVRLVVGAPSFVHVFGLTGGRLLPLIPAQHAAPSQHVVGVKIEALVPTDLPGSLVLDAAREEEWLFVLVSPKPVAPVRAKQLIQQATAGAYEDRTLLAGGHQYVIYPINITRQQ